MIARLLGAAKPADSPLASVGQLEALWPHPTSFALNSPILTVVRVRPLGSAAADMVGLGPIGGIGIFAHSVSR